MHLVDLSDFVPIPGIPPIGSRSLELRARIGRALGGSCAGVSRYHNRGGGLAGNLRVRGRDVFANRLRWFVILMIVLALIIVTRLVDVQILRADQYQTLAENMITRPDRYLSAPRGGILDRNSTVLVRDEPASDVSVRYEVLQTLLSDDLPPPTRKYLEAVGRALRKRGEFPAEMPLREIVARLETATDEMWDELARLAGLTRFELAERAGEIRRRVQRVKEYVQSRSRTIRAIAEETGFHPILAELDEDVALGIRVGMEARYPWLRVTPSSRRVAYDAEPLVHVLGNIGAVGPRRIENDPLAEDELAGLRPGERCGISGVERLAELTLRGRRGRVIEDFDRTEIERIDPLPGGDVRLTIDANLQRRIYELLGRTVEQSLDTETPFGGAAAVVLDAHTREVLTLVSYPAYPYENFWTQYVTADEDKRWERIRFRAVANGYPPGSTCKVIGLYGGLAEGVVTPQTPIECTGHFRANMPESFRCWIYRQYHTTHGVQIAEDAIRNSCNIYFYTVGDRLGVDRLCHWFSMFGLGKTQGTGLIEEAVGIVPDSAWIRANRAADPTPRPADAWNFAIGQGEVTATPLQVANVAATIATGRWEPVKLLLDENLYPVGGAADPPIQFDDKYLQVLRKGMWRVINERGGTAYDARLKSDEFEMCGKTGSAQAAPRTIRKKYVLRRSDGRREEVIAPSLRAALERYGDEKPEVISDSVYEYFPSPDAAGGSHPSHAWFMSYTQPRGTPRGAGPSGQSYALGVVIEYGGSGGRVAGPVAREIARIVNGLEADGGGEE